MSLGEQDAYALGIARSEPGADGALVTDTIWLSVGQSASLGPVADTVLNLSPNSVTVAWTSSDPGVAGVTSEGVVTGLSTGATTVQAYADESTASIPVTVVATDPPPPPPPEPPLPPGSSYDRIIVDHEAGWSDANALVSGHLSNGTCWVDELRAFASYDDLGPLDSACPERNGRVAVFSEERAAAVEDVVWSGAYDEVDLTGQPEPFDVPLAIWIALDGVAIDYVADKAKIPKSQVLDFSRDMLQQLRDYADRRFRASRTGIGFSDVATVEIASPSDLAALLTPAGNLPNLPYDLCGAYDALSVEDSFTDDLLNVYYVGGIDPYYGTGGALAGRNWLGVHCRYESTDVNDRNEDIIYLSSTWLGTSVLGHELGHAMGLAFPHGGHVGAGQIQGFSDSNMMAGVVADTIAASFTLGQAFRMSVEPESWLNHAVDADGPLRPTTWPRIGCPCNPYSNAVCPLLFAPDQPTPLPDEDDVGHSCLDARQLDPPSGSWGTGNEPVGLVSGRRWRDQVCVRNVWTEPYDATEVDTLFHANLDSGEGCDPRLTIFTTRYGLAVSEDPELWTHLVDNDRSSKPSLALPPPIDIPVNVWSGPADAIGEAWDSVETVYACGLSGCGSTGIAPNRTGIRPTLNDRTSPALSPGELSAALNAVGSCSGALTGLTDGASVAVGEINVYFVGPDPVLAGDDGATCLDDATNTGLLVIPLGAPSSSLAHHLGHVWGLEHEPALPASNVMRVAGVGDRSGLTLGQVFWMHMDSLSWLANSALGPPSRPDIEIINCRVSASAAGVVETTPICPTAVADVP